MCRRTTIAIRVGYVFLILFLLFLAYPRPARTRSGGAPGARIRANLSLIAEAKEILKDRHGRPDVYWPTRSEIAAAWTGKTGAPFEAVCKRTYWGEIYIVNRIGAPAYAYLPDSVGGLPEGYLLTLAELEKINANSRGRPASAMVSGETPSNQPGAVVQIADGEAPMELQSDDQSILAPPSLNAAEDAFPVYDRIYRNPGGQDD